MKSLLELLIRMMFERASFRQSGSFQSSFIVRGQLIVNIYK